ncbi:MAG TPA: methyltransferase domain-containing protein [Solirubrobacteraceae bacterium]|nr:methyltransferase domain-containing protein [Solirubrobacteraceae bacterium]
MTDYALGREGAEEAELTRLGLLAELHDPLTERQLDAIGVEPGWRCLDAGAGAGAVTRLLAARVGSTGSVLAIDLDTRLLDGVASETVEVRRQDVLADPLPQATFDLAHARALLMHLPARLVALQRLHAAVRPGGWLAICEPDFTSIDLAPSSPGWRRTFSAFCDATVATGWDPRYGARLQADLEAVELTDIKTERCGGDRVQGGSPWTGLFAATLERLRDRLRTLGADDQDLDETQRLLREPSMHFTHATTWLSSGRREQP